MKHAIIMRFLLAFSCLILLAMAICGCNKTEWDDETGLDNTSASAIEIGYEKLTGLEISLLSDFYPNQADRIQEGKLFSHQKEALLQLRAAIVYLDEMYPNTAFEPILFTPATKFNPDAELTVLDPDDRETEYTVYVEPKGGEDGYLCFDTCYGKFLQPVYDQYVEEVFASAGHPGIVTHTAFYSAVSAKFWGGEDLVEDLFQNVPKLARLTTIIVPKSSFDANPVSVEELKTILTEAGLYGAYTGYIESDDYREISISFNCFDAIADNQNL